MENEDKITFSFRKTIGKLDLDENEDFLESFLIFKTKEDVSEFLTKFGKQNDDIESNRKNTNHGEGHKLINYEGDLCELIQIYSIIPAILIKSNFKFIESIVNYDNIECIDGNFRIYLSSTDVTPYQDTKFIKESFLKPTGSGIKIALLDSGIDIKNPYLVDSVLKRINITNEEELDLVGHGTMVAGIICGKPNDFHSEYEGIAPNVKLLDVKIITKSGLGHISNIISGLESIRKENVDIIFFGAISPTGNDESNILGQICKELKKKMILIAPAGNFGPENDTIGIPSSSPDVFCIGSTRDNNYISIFTSRGIVQNGNLKPDLYFNGNNIITTQSRKGILGKEYNQSENLCKMSGTSSSAAIFAGIIALLLELNSDLDKVKILKKLRNYIVKMKTILKEEQLQIMDIKSLFEEFNSLFPNYLSFKQIVKISLIISSIAVIVLISVFLLFLL